MTKGKLNTRWNRFWLLVSLLWMGACWCRASTVNVPSDEWVIVEPAQLQQAKDAERMQAIHNREFLIALGTIGFVLWFLARFVRYGFAFGFKSTEPSPGPPAASTR
jgi:hypothetical protein